MPVGPPPTSHFHILSDTPSGLQPVNPARTAQPSAAKHLIDLDKKLTSGGSNRQGDANSNNNFGLKLDQYNRKSSVLKNKATREWTEQETLLLLEGLSTKTIGTKFASTSAPGLRTSAFSTFCVCPSKIPSSRMSSSVVPALGQLSEEE